MNYVGDNPQEYKLVANFPTSKSMTGIRDISNNIEDEYRSPPKYNSGVQSTWLHLKSKENKQYSE